MSNAVLLVHGIWDTGAIFRSMRSYLAMMGLSVYDLNMTPNNGDSRLEHLAEQVANYIDQTFEADTPIDIVGFSMGGLVSRYYIQQLGGIERVQRFITLSSPHNGTLTAYGSFRPGCMQMRPNSPFLRTLNRDVAMLAQINFTSIWTPMDTMILPASSSQMPVGKNVKVLVPTHAWMVRSPQSLLQVNRALAEPLRGTAGRSPNQLYRAMETSANDQ